MTPLEFSTTTVCAPHSVQTGRCACVTSSLRLSPGKTHTSALISANRSPDAEALSAEADSFYYCEPYGQSPGQWTMEMDN